MKGPKWIKQYICPYCMHDTSKLMEDGREFKINDHLKMHIQLKHSKCCPIM